MDSADKRIRPWHAFGLPFWWYLNVLRFGGMVRQRAIRSKTPCIQGIAYAVWLGVCLGDVKYVERAVKLLEGADLAISARWQAFLDIGLAFYDLGDREQGIAYLERAAELSLEHPEAVKSGYATLWQLCSRLTETKDCDKRLRYARHCDARWPASMNDKVALAGKHISEGEFEEARKITEELAGSDDEYPLLSGDLYYAEQNFRRALDIYERYELSPLVDFLSAQYDYKLAALYYLTGQEGKWKKAAARMGRRLNWDRFYSLAYLESEGVERIAELDDFIRQVRSRRLLFDATRMRQYVMRMPRIVWSTFVWYRYHALAALFIAGVILACAAMLLKLVVGNGAGWSGLA